MPLLSKARKSRAERIQEQEDRLAKEKNRLEKLVAADRAAQRKKEDAENYMLGQFMRAAAAEDAEVKAFLAKTLTNCVMRERERELLAAWLPPSTT